MNAHEHYARAGELDTAGDEEGAIAHYDLAYAQLDDLRAEDIEHFFVGYGSTLRNVGRQAESLAILRRGLDRYPNSSALRAFEAITLAVSGHEREAVANLLRVLIAPNYDRSAQRFTRSITGYAADLAGDASEK